MSETVDILGTHAVRLAFERALLPAWAARGESHRISWGVSNILAEQIIGGLRGDVVVLSDAWMERFARDGIIDPATLRPIAQARIGIGVRAGENLPTIETVEQLVAVLRSSRAVAWSRRGASGVHFEKLIDNLGIGDEVRGRGVVVDSGFTAEKLTSGEVDIAVQLVSEIMSVDGVEVAALFPAALQAPANFSVAVFAQTSNRAAGRRFVDFLTSEAAAQAYVAGGLIPAPC